MKVVYSPDHVLHDPQTFLTSGRLCASPEMPERANILVRAARAVGCDIIPPEDAGTRAAASVHTPAYLHFLQTIHNRWRAMPNASEEVIPNIHPTSRTDSYPTSPIGLAGFHLGDTACPVGAGTYQAALHATHCATTAAALVLAGESSAYALCRPPGHHAAADLAGGFCFFNNAAIAAQHLRLQHDRVAIIDVDLHHGNGTQQIFYQRADILTSSVHADPTGFYPFFWGHACERGEGSGLGYNINVPLAFKSGDDLFIDALDTVLDHVKAFNPGAVVVALGLDASEHDPFGGLSLTTAGFRQVAEALAALELPTVLVQEGGYICDALGSNLAAVLNVYKQQK